jgi:aspartate aminotransferase-like enzyme
VFKPRLLAPGPTPVPEDTLLELAQPMFYHRSSRYRALLAQVTADLQYMFQTTAPVVTLTASGTGGMEAALASAVPPGGKVIGLIAGRWGERWANIAKALGMEFHTIAVPYGEAVPPEALEAALRQHPDTRAVCSTLCETATGVKNDVAAYGRICGPTPAVLLVDAISGLGAMECRTEDWGLDVVVAGSQKGLMLPPGLAFVSVSAKAQEEMRKQTPRTFYFNICKYVDSLKTNDSPFTPANGLVRGLAKSLAVLRAQGIETLWARYAQLARMARAGITALGLELFAKVPAEAMTVARVPDTLDGNALVHNLESWYGVKLAGGQDTLKGKIVRLAHMGHIDAFDILAALSALELTLARMGWAVEPGSALAAAQRVLHEATEMA